MDVLGRSCVKVARLDFSIFYVAIKKDMENRLPLTAFSDKAEDLLTYEQCVLC